MDAKDLANELKKHSSEVENLMRRKLPVIVGRMAKDHYQENFRKGGFQNRGLRKWPVTRRQTSGIAGADGQYGPLLSRRNHLFASIKYVPSDFKVLVSNDLPYAPIHNWGGETNPTVTARMRRFAWAMYYHTQGTSKKPTGGKRKPKNTKSASKVERLRVGEQSSRMTPSAQFWKGLALTKKKRLRVRIPQRQFIGESEELNQRIRERIEKERRIGHFGC